LIDLGQKLHKLSEISLAFGAVCRQRTIIETI